MGNIETGSEETFRIFGQYFVSLMNNSGNESVGGTIEYDEEKRSAFEKHQEEMRKKLMKISS